MQISSRFTVAVHILACVEYFGTSQKLTSDFMAGSIGVNPVVVRRLLGGLKAAGLVEVARGTGGTKLSKPASDITLLDVYRAVDAVENESIFHFHEHPNGQCPVGKSIHFALDDKLAEAQKALEDKLAASTIADVAKDVVDFNS